MSKAWILPWRRTQATSYEPVINLAKNVELLYGTALIIKIPLISAHSSFKIKHIIPILLNLNRYGPKLYNISEDCG